MKNKPLERSPKTVRAKATLGRKWIAKTVSQTKGRTADVLEIKKSVYYWHKIPWTDLELTHSWHELVIMWQLFQFCEIWDNKRVFLSLETWEITKLYINWTDEFVKSVLQTYNFCNKKVTKVTTNKRNSVYIDSITWKEFKLYFKWTKEEIWEMWWEHKIWKYRVRKLKDGWNWNTVWINVRTLAKIEFKIAWTNDLITEFYCNEEIIFNGIKIKHVRINDKERIWINTATFEKVDLTIKWTKYRIKEFKEKLKVGNLKLQKVEIVHERPTNSCVYIPIIIFINPETLEPLLIEWKCVVEIEKIWPKTFKCKNTDRVDYIIKL